MSDPSHEWGPHKGDPAPIIEARQERTRVAYAKMVEIARRESSWRP